MSVQDYRQIKRQAVRHEQTFSRNSQSAITRLRNGEQQAKNIYKAIENGRADLRSFHSTFERLFRDFNSKADEIINKQREMEQARRGNDRNRVRELEREIRGLDRTAQGLWGRIVSMSNHDDAINGNLQRYLNAVESV